jgi:hypothetical protein
MIRVSVLRRSPRPGLRIALALVLAVGVLAVDVPVAHAEPDVEITTPSPLPGGKVGVFYSQTLAASGGTPPYSWSVVGGTVPSGLALSAGGILSGAPSAAGTFSFTVQVQDAGEPTESAQKQFTVTIAPADLVITTMSLPGGKVGVGYSQTVSATGGTVPYQWDVFSGSLPPGLSLSVSGTPSATLSGTPAEAGTFNFTVRVRDAGSPQQSHTRQFTVTIDPPDLVLVTTSLPNGQEGATYEQTLTASGGTPPYQWDVFSGSLPPGLSLSVSGTPSATLSGTPAATGTFNFTVRVRDAGNPQQSHSRPFTITINGDPDIPDGAVTIRDAVANPKVEFAVGEMVVIDGTFDDPNLLDVHTVTVAWGDGTVTETVLLTGARDFEVSHAYTSPGFFFITLTVDDGIGSDSWPGVVVVGGVLGPSGPATVGLVDPTQGQWHLRSGSGQVTSFFYGNPGDIPFMGDWNCNGIDSPGMYRQSDGFVYLRNSSSQGIADIRFFFGNPGDMPIVGDFNGDGCDTVSIYRPSEGRFFIINRLGENEGGLGAAEFSYFFGNLGDKPFVGDFDGNGIDTVGLHRESTGLVYFRNTHTQGSADHQFIFGNPGDRLVAGDWNGDSLASPGIFRPGDATFYLRFTNTQGPADMQFEFGSGGWLPVAGNLGLP